MLNQKKIVKGLKILMRSAYMVGQHDLPLTMYPALAAHSNACGLKLVDMFTTEYQCKQFLFAISGYFASLQRMFMISYEGCY